MKLFDKRPLCLACTAALLLSFVFIYAGPYAVFAAAVCAAVSAVVFCIIKVRTWRTVLVVCGAALIMCAAFFIYFIGTKSISTKDAVKVSGYAVPDSENDYTCVYKITKANGKPVNIKAIAYTEGVSCEDYEEFEAYASFTLYEGYSEYYYKSAGVLYTAEFTDFVKTGKIHKNVSYYAGKLRAFAASCLYRVCDCAGILCRLFLGIKDKTPSGFLSDMKTLGVSHLLAVSGLHVTALLAGGDFVLTRISGKTRVKYVILSCFALLYMAVTGFTGSVVRASVMYLLSRLSLITGRKNDPVTSLLVSAFIIVSVNPLSVYDVGFLLSFTAALGIIVGGAPASKYIEEKLPQKFKFLSRIASPVIITLFVLLFTLPVAASSYGAVAYGAVLYNVVVSPFAVVLLYACPYIVIFSFVPFVGRGMGLLADGLCTVLVKLVHALAEHAAPSVSVSYPFVIPLIAAFIIAAAVLAVFSKKRFHYLCLALAFILAFSSFAAIFSLTEAKKTFIMVSAGKYGSFAAVIEHNKCTVFDFTTGTSDGSYQLYAELLKHGITRVDYVLASEPGSRHLQSVIRLCSYFDIDNIYAPSSIAEELSAFCGKDVETADKSEQKYGGAALIKDNGTLLLCVGDAAYIDRTDSDAPFNTKRYKTVILNDKAQKTGAFLPEDTYYTNEEVLVVYINE